MSNVNVPPLTVSSQGDCDVTVGPLCQIWLGKEMVQKTNNDFGLLVVVEIRNMVVKYTGEDLYKSTYASLYAKSPRDTQQRRNYNQLPRLCESLANQVVSRNHPDYIGTRKYVRPPGLAHDHPICLGLGSYAPVPIQNTDKPIVRMKPPQDREINLADLRRSEARRKACKTKEKETLDDLIVRLRWISNIKREEKNNCLPVPSWQVPNTTLEDNSDVVRHRPQRYEHNARDWQKVSCAWNRVQFRPNHAIPSAGVNKKYSAKGTFWENRQRKIDDLCKDLDSIEIPDQCRNRKVPGYAGFVPREPVATTSDPSCSEIFRSSASRTYRDFPANVMHDPRTMSKHRKAPMSRMITLVYPCNPYKLTPNTMHTCINPIYH